MFIINIMLNTLQIRMMFLSIEALGLIHHTEEHYEVLIDFLNYYCFRRSASASK